MMRKTYLVKREAFASRGEIRSANDERRAEGDSPKPLGEILVESGVVSPAVLDQALSQQKKVGEILLEQKAVTPQ